MPMIAIAESIVLSWRHNRRLCDRGWVPPDGPSLRVLRWKPKPGIGLKSE
jgi:hypothetical protein